MKKLIIKFGLIGSALMIGAGLITLAIFGTDESGYAIGELIGYLSIMVAMGLIIVAQLNYRKDNNGILSFADAFKMGLGISTIGGLAFGIYNAVYVVWIAPDFMKQYFAYSEGIEMSDPSFDAKYQMFVESYGIFASTFGQSLLMFLTVFLIGFVVSITGGLIFQQKPVKA